MAFATPRLLVAAGVPLDTWIVTIGRGMSIYVSREAALWLAALFVGFLLYAGSVALSKDHNWTPQVPDVFKRLWKKMDPWHLVTVGSGLVAIGLTLIVIGIVWQWPPKSPQAGLASPFAGAGTLPVATALSAEEQQRHQRQSMLKTRGELELSVRDASGTPIRVVFGQSNTETLRIKERDTEYELVVAISNSMAAFVFSGNGSAKTVYLSRSAPRGKPVDIRQLRPSKGGVSVSIGQHAFVELTDGKILQLLVASVQWYNEGDDVDEVRFKYKIFDAGEFLIDAL